MRKAFLVLFVVLSLASMAVAQISDAPRTSLQDGWAGDPSGENSQWVYIRVTMAGVVFQISNQDWIIGDASTTAPGDWYAFPRNTYLSANGVYEGAFPPSWITHTGAYAFNFSAAATGGEAFNNGDCPILWNQGGVSLDFFLGVASMSGWFYDTRHFDNRLTDAAALTTEALTGPVFKNAFQLRAIFLRWAAGSTASYDDAAGAAMFKFPTASNVYAGGYAGVPPAAFDGVDVVLTTDAFLAAVDVTDAIGDAATGRAWAEATTNRFDPTDARIAANDGVPTMTKKGLGIPPDSRCTIALSLMTPREVTAAFRTYLRVQKILKLRVYGTPSDARD